MFITSSLLLPSFAFLSLLPISFYPLQSSQVDPSKIQLTSRQSMLKTRQWLLLHLEWNSVKSLIRYNLAPGDVFGFFQFPAHQSVAKLASLLHLNVASTLSSQALHLLFPPPRKLNSWLTLSLRSLPNCHISKRPSWPPYGPRHPRTHSHSPSRSLALGDTGTCLYIIHIYWFTLFICYIKTQCLLFCLEHLAHRWCQ